MAGIHCACARAAFFARCPLMQQQPTVGGARAAAASTTPRRPFLAGQQRLFLVVAAPLALSIRKGGEGCTAAGAWHAKPIAPYKQAAAAAHGFGAPIFLRVAAPHPTPPVFLISRLCRRKVRPNSRLAIKLDLFFRVSSRVLPPSQCKAKRLPPSSSRQRPVCQLALARWLPGQQLVI